MTLPLLPGRAGRIAPTLPNWNEPVRVAYEFSTGIVTSREGHEQRWANRQRARVAVRFNTMLTQRKLQRFMADLAESGHEPFTVIAPWRRTEIAAGAAPGATVLTVTAPPFWLVAGSSIVLAAPDFWEAAQVLSVAGSAVTISGGLSRAFPSGTTLYGAYRARAPEEPQFQAHTATVWTGEMIYDVDPGSDPQATPAASPALFEGREVFLTRPDWSDRPRVSFRELREMVDSEFGVVQSSSPTRRTDMELRLRYVGLDAESSEDLIAFFLRHKGRRGSFWMPTWQRDLTPTGTVASGATTFTVAGTDAFYGFSGSDLYNVVIARWPGGHQVNRVTGLAIVSGNTRFTFANPWSASLDAAAMISWCPRWRFETDRLEVSRQTSTVAEMQFALVTIRNGGT